MEQRTVKVKDKNGIIHNWIIESETKKAYQIFCNGIITYVYKNKCYYKSGQLFSSEIRNINYNIIPDCLDCYECFKCFDEEFEEYPQYEEDRSIDMGYLEPDTYGLDIIYDSEGKAYGV